MRCEYGRQLSQANSLRFLSLPWRDERLDGMIRGVEQKGGFTLARQLHSHRQHQSGQLDGERTQPGRPTQANEQLYRRASDRTRPIGRGQTITVAGTPGSLPPVGRLGEGLGLSVGRGRVYFGVL